MEQEELKIGVDAAYRQACKSFEEGGIPIGSCITLHGKILAEGHNQRVQSHSNIRHGEMDCIERAGHQTDLSNATIFSSLTPCLMCTGAIILFKIPRVVILDNINIDDFETDLSLLKCRGVEILILSHNPSVELNKKFQTSAGSRKIWLGDVGL